MPMSPVNDQSDKPMWLATAARLRFEAGDFAAAREAYERAFAAGDASAETVAALHAIYADAGDHVAIARLFTDLLDRVEADVPSAQVAGWAAALFDAVALTERDAGHRAEAALRLLEAAAAAGEEGWDVVLVPERRSAIAAAFVGPLATLELLEQESFAPPATGLPARAVALAEALGRSHAAEPTVARAAERLLHALGERDAAYRVEATRRAANRPRATEAGDRSDRERSDSPDLRGLVVVVAGGHPALRALVRVDLTGSGVAAVREVPSAWEAVRRAREVEQQVAGADIAVLVGRRLAHSTADQVRAAAARLGVPVVAAQTAGVAAVRRAVEAHVAPLPRP